MGAWEDERPVYGDESDLTPQQKEQMAQEASMRREIEYRRGRRAVQGMLILYSASQIIALVAWRGRSLVRLMGLALAVALVYNIWHGKRWARKLFAVLAVWSILVNVHGISQLNTARTDYSGQQSYSGGATLYISGLDGVKTIQEMTPEEIADLQETEDVRVKYHRIIFAAYLIDIAICAGYLYILFGYRPAKEFLYGQS